LVAAEGVELVGVWGRSEARALTLATRLGVRVYEDVETLIGDVDAVAFAVPPDVQGELALMSARAGKHLLLDKPVAMSPAAARAVRDAASSAGVASVVFFTDRFVDGSRTWLQHVQRTEGWRGGWFRWFSSLQEADNPFGSSPWRWQHGALWDIGPHALSVLVPALGPVDSVQAGAGLRDTVHLVLGHESGVASTVTLSHTVAPLSAGTEFFVHGDAGRIVLIPEERAALRAFAVAVDELTAAAVAGGTHPCDVAFGRDVVAVLETATRALASGCRELV
jgi:predicted dehydrogenase